MNNEEKYLEKIQKIEEYAKENYIPIIKKEAIEYILNIFDRLLKYKIEDEINKCQSNKKDCKKIDINFRILELGSAIAYSGIRFVKFILDQKARYEKEYNIIINLELLVLSCEKDEERFLKANENIDSLNFLEIDKYLKIYNLDAEVFLEKIQEEFKGKEGEFKYFDIAFIDANKSSYLKYYLNVKDIINEKGVLLFDNILFNGWVFGNYTEKKHRTIVNNLRNFIHYLDDNKIKYSIEEKADGVLKIEKGDDVNF